MVELGWRLDLTLEIFANRNDSMILWFYDKFCSICHAVLHMQSLQPLMAIDFFI